MAKSGGKRRIDTPVKKSTASRQRGSAGKRKKKQKAKNHWGALGASLAAVALLAGGYGALCLYASHSEVLYPNTLVLGQDLGGMSRGEAEAYLTDSITATYQGKALSILVGSTTVELPLEDAVQVDSAQAVDKAWNASRTERVLTSGYRYLQSMLTETEVEIGEYVTFSNLDAVLENLQQELGAQNAAVVETTYEITDAQLVLTKGTSGQTVDLDALRSEIVIALEAGDYTNPIQCPMVLSSPSDFDLQAVYDQVYVEPVSAQLTDDAQITDDVVGVSFDLEQTRQAFSAAAEGSTVTADLIFTEAEVTSEQLSELLFRDLLGTASSNVGGTSARISNVKLATSFVDETILNPGKEFSYNNVVGQRTTERGFQAAPAYSGGETVQEVGGGICQVSSTVYLAALRANLEIVERRNHSYICSYMPYGEDATVSWGGPDLVIKNNTDYPIKVLTSYSGGVLTAEVYGTNLTGEYVKVTNEVISTSSYETVYQDTTELAAGETQVKTSGYNGMRVKVYRNVYASDDTLLSTTLESDNTYRVRNKVVLRGIASTQEEQPDTPATSDPPQETPQETPVTPVESPEPEPVETGETPSENTEGTTETEE